MSSALAALKAARSAITLPQVMVGLRGFEAGPTDVLVCTYPRSGTTWNFAGLRASEERVSQACERAQIAVMRDNPERFGDVEATALLARAMRLPGMPHDSLVRPDARRARPAPATLRALNDRWSYEIGGPLGLPSYDALRDAVEAALALKGF